MLVHQLAQRVSREQHSALRSQTVARMQHQVNELVMQDMTEGVMVLDAQATPVMAQDVLRHIRTVTDLPVKHVVLSHYHAVRVLGASAYVAEGATEIIASKGGFSKRGP